MRNKMPLCFQYVHWLRTRQYAISEFSRFSDLAPKLRRESKANCKVAFLGIKNKEPW